MKRIGILIGGWIALAIGGIGIFLPVLPTTPFVLLAAICFSLSSEKMYQVLLRSKLFGPYIENYRSKKGVPLAVKVRAILWLWFLLGISAVAIQKLWAIFLFLFIGTGVTIHLIQLPTKQTVGQKQITDIKQK